MCVLGSNNPHIGHAEGCCTETQTGEALTDHRGIIVAAHDPEHDEVGKQDHHFNTHRRQVSVQNFAHPHPHAQGDHERRVNDTVHIDKL